MAPGWLKSKRLSSEQLDSRQTGSLADCLVNRPETEEEKLLQKAIWSLQLC